MRSIIADEGYLSLSTKLHKARYSLIEKISETSFLDDSQKESFLPIAQSSQSCLEVASDVPIIKTLKTIVNLLSDLENLSRNVVEPTLSQKSLLVAGVRAFTSRNDFYNLVNHKSKLQEYSSQVISVMSLGNPPINNQH